MILLGIGSNMPSSFGDRFDNIDLAVSLLNEKGVQLIKKSSFYETFAYPNKNDPKFINIVTSVRTYLQPVDLMSILISIEEKLERKRRKKNDPRTCDIDIIDYNNKVLNFQYRNLQLEIPHKKLISRNFVLLPLQEIDPAWKHPNTEETIATLIQNLPSEDRKSILKVEKN